MSSEATSEPPKPEFSDFMRENSFQGMSIPSMISLAATSLGTISQATLPQNVPWYVIDAMAYDPHISLAEQIWAAPLQDATIYRVEHPDPAIKAETEAWLKQRLVKSPLLRAITSAFAYGSSPYIFDWVSRDLKLQVPREGKKPLNRNLRDHVHYSSVHDIHPGDVQLKVRSDQLLELHYAGDVFKATTGRPFVSVWGKRFGRWEGFGSRRRAYSAWYEGEHTRIWKGRYLERSVDPPRVGYAPPGTININGKDISAAAILRSAIMALKGGGTAILPGGFEGDSTTERAWSIDVLDLPDRSKVWFEALDVVAVNKFIASMVPPSAAGIADAAFASGRVHVELFQELLNVASNWVAEELEAPVECVHRANYGDEIPPPRIIAREFPRAKAKKMLEIFKAVSGAARTAADGKEVTLAELIDVSILEELGVKMRPIAEAARERRAAPGGGPGKQTDSTSDRDDRRDNAREPEGEDATGNEGEQVDA